MKSSRVFVVLVLTCLVGLSACADSVAPYPEPPEVPVPPTSSSIPDYSNVSLAPVQGSTTVPAPAIQNGRATLSGTVKLNGAPVGGASVQLDRFVGNASTTLTVTTNDQGVYRAQDIQGGRYRVRAFRSPDATTTTPKTFFMLATEQKNLDLDLSPFSGGSRYAYNFAPNPPVVGQLFNVAASISTTSVDASGFARSVGVPGVPVRLDTDGGRALVSPQIAITNSSGVATWQLRCDALQNQGITISWPDGKVDRPSIAACQPAPSTTTTVADSTTTTRPSTTTTVRR